MGSQYLGVALGATALLLVIILFVIVIVNNINNHHSEPEQPTQKKHKNVINAVGFEHIELEKLPASVDGVLLEFGHHVFLNNQHNNNENGMYEVVGANQWNRLPNHTNESDIEAYQALRNKVTISDSEMSLESRRLHSSEIIHKQLIIAGNDIILPEPQDFSAASVGEIYRLTVLNTSENEIELGYTSAWLSKCVTTCLDAQTGTEFILRITETTSGEIYRV